MIETVRFQNFKALRDVEVGLSRLTVLVGANGVGKTTVLDGLERLSRFCELLIPLSPEKRHVALHRAFARGPDTWTHNLHPHELGLSVGLSDGQGLGFRFRPQIWSESGGANGFSIEVAGREMQPNEVKTAADQLRTLALTGFGSSTRLRLDPSRLVAASPAVEEVPRLSADGSGLATVLQHLASQRDGILDSIEAALAKLVPGFERVKTFPTQAVREKAHPNGPILERVPGYGFALQFTTDGEVRSEHVSEGTLLLLGILTALHDRPTRLLLLDDIERGLHPVAQHRFVEHIYGVLEQDKELQIVVTTHSPDVVNACQPEDVRVLSRAEDGDVRVSALGEHPEAEKWLKLIRPGEFWSTVGEDWVAER